MQPAFLVECLPSLPSRCPKLRITTCGPLARDLARLAHAPIRAVGPEDPHLRACADRADAVRVSVVVVAGRVRRDAAARLRNAVTLLEIRAGEFPLQEPEHFFA